nr:VPA1262 family N-terminal domain-containing protein [Moraxella sp. CTOTU47724]
MQPELLLNYYDYAEIRYAIAVANGTFKLIFATVRLLPKDKPVSYTSDAIRSNHGDITMIARKVVLKAEDALKWYRRDDNLSAPTPSSEQRILNFEVDNKNQKSIAIKLTDETVWGDFGNPLREKSFFNEFSDNSAPFLGYASDRIHRRFGQQNGLKELLELEEIRLFLKQNLFIDLRKYYEYLGGIVLILPNPIIESIEDRLFQTEEGEKRLLKLNAYPSQNLSKINLINFETYLGNLKNLQIIDSEAIQSDNGLIIIPHTNPYQSHGYFLLHDDLGCLELRQPTSYLRQANIRMSMHTEKVAISTKQSESKNAKNYTHEISLAEKVSEHAVGELTPDEIYDRVVKARQERQLMIEKIESGQVWFSRDESDDRQKAIDLIKEITLQAEERVWFFDPYFGDLQITQFAVIPSLNDVPTEIITSRQVFANEKSSKKNKNKFNFDCISLKKLFFRYIPPSLEKSGLIKTTKDYISTFFNFAFDTNCDNSQDSRITAQSMLDELNHVKSQSRKDNLPLECCVLDSNNIPLHDRFLVVDEDVWFIGHSFNQLGLQNSFMIRVPAPQELLLKLDAIKSQAISLENFIKKNSSKLEVLDNE